MQGDNNHEERACKEAQCEWIVIQMECTIEQEDRSISVDLSEESEKERCLWSVSLASQKWKTNEGMKELRME